MFIEHHCRLGLQLLEIYSAVLESQHVTAFGALLTLAIIPGGTEQTLKREVSSVLCCAMGLFIQ